MAVFAIISQMHPSRSDFSVAPATLVSKHTSNQICKTEHIVSAKPVPFLVSPFSEKGTTLYPAGQARNLVAVLDS